MVCLGHLVVATGHAQVPEAPVERGFKPEQTYSFSGVDQVNLFNGNLTLTLPIGDSFQVGPELSYGLTLVYNSNLWDYEYQLEDGGAGQDCNIGWLAAGFNDSCVSIGGPSRAFNAGLGWRLSLGELLEPCTHEEPCAPGSSSDGWLYRSADGGTHTFWPFLHEGDGHAGTGELYARDGSYLRLQPSKTTPEVEFPNGVVHRFEKTTGGRWLLSEMVDPYGNSVTVDVSDVDHWVITDSVAGEIERRHTIDFAVDTLPDGESYRRLETVDVEAFGGQRAVYRFSYAEPTAYYPSCLSSQPGVPQFTYDLRLLQEVRLEGSDWSYGFNYYPDDSIPYVYPGFPERSCSAIGGRLERMVLPTGGGYHWDYRGYPTPTQDCTTVAPPPVPGPHPNGINPGGIGNLSAVWGVAARVELDASGAEVSRVDYKLGGPRTLDPPPPECETLLVFGTLRNIEYHDLGNDKVSRTDHFFSLWSTPGVPTADGWTPDEFGLPFTREPSVPHPGLGHAVIEANPYVLDGKEYYLSRRVYRCDDSNRATPETLAGCELYRTHYLRYERSFRECNPWEAGPLRCSELNQREAGEIVVYSHFSSNPAAPNTDQRLQVKDFSDFDGFGHYRTSTLRNDFPGPDSGNGARTTTRYNPDRGTYAFNPETGQATGGLVLPARTERWLVDRFDRSETYEPGKGSASVHYCFDVFDTSVGDPKGFLQWKRTLAGSSAQSGDLLERFVDLAGIGTPGFPDRQFFFGGDRHPLPEGFVSCGDSVPSEPEYRADHEYEWSRLKRSVWVDEEGDEVLSLVDLDIDPTGRASRSRAASGLETRYDYDALGRLTSARPDGLADTTITYDLTSRPAETTVTLDSVTGGTEEIYRYDGMGRIVEVERAMPYLQRAWKRIEHYPGGLKWRETPFQPKSTQVAQWTTYRDYDPFGRVGKTTPPDGASKATRFVYGGVSSVTRIQQYDDPALGPLDNVVYRKYNGLGRLVGVHETSGFGGTPPEATEIRTEYLYDIGGRLATVRVNAPQVAATERSSFVYDNRGFLLSEKHPEIGGPGGNQAITYGGYDALGNVGARSLPSVAGGTPSTSFDLDYRYDRAGRLTQVLQEGAPLKELFYARPSNGADFRGGQLVAAKRRNQAVSSQGEFGATEGIVVTERFAYNGPAGQPSARETRTSDGRQFLVEATYDDLGEVASVTYPQCEYPAGCGDALPARTVETTHQRGYVTGVTGFASDFRYHANGLLRRFDHANGLQDRQVLLADGAGVPYELPLVGNLLVVDASQTSDVYLELGPFEYDAARNITAMGADTFGYDPLQRLIRADLPDEPVNGLDQDYQTYTYDRYGNLLDISGHQARAFSIDSSSNRLNGEGFAYDVAGNLVRRSGELPLSPRRFDAFNSLVSEEKTGVNREMLYTANDERLAVIDHLGDRERWTLRGVKEEVLRALERSVATGVWSWRKDSIYRGPVLLAEVTPDGAQEKVAHLHLDHLGTPRLKTDDAKEVQVLAEYKYWPYGERTVATSTDDDDLLRFTGHERDFNRPEGAGAGVDGIADDLDYMHARYYSPWLGRFLSVDPRLGRAEDPQSWNRFSYASNNPLTRLDPDGRAHVTPEQRERLEQLGPVGMFAWFVAYSPVAKAEKTIFFGIAWSFAFPVALVADLGVVGPFRLIPAINKHFVEAGHESPLALSQVMVDSGSMILHKIWGDPSPEDHPELAKATEEYQKAQTRAFSATSESARDALNAQLRAARERYFQALADAVAAEQAAHEEGEEEVEVEEE
jgi:RHS repeat-associated protein